MSVKIEAKPARKGRSSRGLRLSRRAKQRSQVTYNGVHSYTQTVVKTSVTNSTTVFTGGAFDFSLSDIDQASTFDALYDEYKIDKIDITFYPRWDQASSAVSLSGSAASGYFYVAFDKDDSNVPANEATMRELGNVKIRQIGKMMKMTIHPRVAQALYRDGISTGYGSKSDVWCDCAYPNIKHYGLKLGFPATGTVNNAHFDVVCKYYISFRGVR